MGRLTADKVVGNGVGIAKLILTVVAFLCLFGWPFGAIVNVFSV